MLGYCESAALASCSYSCRHRKHSTCCFSSTEKGPRATTSHCRSPVKELLKTGGRSKAQPKKKSHYDKTNRTVNNRSESAQTSSVKHSPPKHSSSKPKIPVPGARKVWGIMKETSASAVITTLTKLTSMSSEQLQGRFSVASQLASA